MLDKSKPSEYTENEPKNGESVNGLRGRCELRPLNLIRVMPA